MNFGTHSNYTQLTKARHELCARLRFPPQRIDAIVKVVDHVSFLSTCSHRCTSACQKLWVPSLAAVKLSQWKASTLVRFKVNYQERI